MISVFPKSVIKDYMMLKSGKTYVQAIALVEVDWYRGLNFVGIFRTDFGEVYFNDWYEAPKMLVVDFDGNNIQISDGSVYFDSLVVLKEIRYDKDKDILYLTIDGQCMKNDK